MSIIQVSSVRFPSYLRQQIQRANGNYKLTMRLDGGDNDPNVILSYGQTVLELRVTINAMSSSSRVNTGALTGRIARGVNRINLGNDFANERIHAAWENAVADARGEGGVTLVVENFSPIRVETAP